MANSQPFNHRVAGFFSKLVDLGDGTHAEQVYVANAGTADTAALITHTAASAGVASVDQTNISGRGVQIGVNITAITGTTPTLQVIVEGKDVASGAYYPLLTSAALSATGFTLLTVYPGGPVTANVAANQALPRTWRVRTVIGGTTPAVTATVGASVLV